MAAKTGGFRVTRRSSIKKELFHLVDTYAACLPKFESHMLPAENLHDLAAVVEMALKLTGSSKHLLDGLRNSSGVADAGLEAVCSADLRRPSLAFV